VEKPAQLFCHQCGRANSVGAWPWTCGGCQKPHFRNPIPVVVALIPVTKNDEMVGLLAVRRNIDPGKGGLAFPGGYIDWGEDAQMAAQRETREETGLDLVGPWVVCNTKITPSGGQILIGVKGPSVDHEVINGLTLEGEQLREVQELVVVSMDAPLVFPRHEMMRDEVFGPLANPIYETPLLKKIMR